MAAHTRFHPTNVDQTYSRYRRRGDLSMDESFFPVLRDDGRAHLLASGAAQPLVAPAVEEQRRAGVLARRSRFSPHSQVIVIGGPRSTEPGSSRPRRSRGRRAAGAASGPRVRTHRRRVRRALCEAAEAEGVEERLAAVEHVVGRQPADRQRLEAVARVDDRVDVRPGPSRTRGSCRACEGRCRRRRSPASRRSGPGSAAARPPGRRRRTRRTPARPRARGCRARTGRARGPSGAIGSPPPVMPVPCGPCGSRCPRRPWTSTRPSRSERSGPHWSRCTTGASGPAGRSVRRRAARTRPPAPSSRRPAGGGRRRPHGGSARAAPHAGDPRPRREHDASRTRNRPSLVAIASTPLSPSSKPTTSTPSRISTPARARAVGELAHGLHRVGPAAAALVQHRLHRRLPVGPGPGQVLAAALRRRPRALTRSPPARAARGSPPGRRPAAPGPPPGSRPAGTRRPPGPDSNISTDIRTSSVIASAR